MPCKCLSAPQYHRDDCEKSPLIKTNLDESILAFFETLLEESKDIQSGDNLHLKDNYLSEDEVIKLLQGI